MGKGSGKWFFSLLFFGGKNVKMAIFYNDFFVNTILIKKCVILPLCQNTLSNMLFLSCCVGTRTYSRICELFYYLILIKYFWYFLNTPRCIVGICPSNLKYAKKSYWIRRKLKTQIKKAKKSILIKSTGLI